MTCFKAKTIIDLENEDTSTFKESKNLSTRCKKCPKHRIYNGIRRCPWGRYIAEIRDLQTKCRQWLGTFESLEEATNSYDKEALSMRGVTNYADCYRKFVTETNDALVHIKPLITENPIH